MPEKNEIPQEVRNETINAADVFGALNKFSKEELANGIPGMNINAIQAKTISSVLVTIEGAENTADGMREKIRTLLKYFDKTFQGPQSEIVDPNEVNRREENEKMIRNHITEAIAQVIDVMKSRKLHTYTATLNELNGALNTIIRTENPEKEFKNYFSATLNKTDEVLIHAMQSYIVSYDLDVEYYINDNNSLTLELKESM